MRSLKVGLGPCGWSYVEPSAPEPELAPAPLDDDDDDEEEACLEARLRVDQRGSLALDDDWSRTVLPDDRNGCKVVAVADRTALVAIERAWRCNSDSDDAEEDEAATPVRLVSALAA